MFSTLEEYHEYIGGVNCTRGYHECIGEGDIMNTSGHVQYIRGYHYECGGYHVYFGRCSVHQRNTMNKSGGIS